MSLEQVQVALQALSDAEDRVARLFREAFAEVGIELERVVRSEDGSFELKIRLPGGGWPEAASEIPVVQVPVQPGEEELEITMEVRPELEALPELLAVAVDPALLAEPVVREGDEDLMDLVERDLPLGTSLANAGGFGVPSLQPEERLRLLAATMVGDVFCFLDLKEAAMDSTGAVKAIQAARSAFIEEAERLGFPAQDGVFAVALEDYAPKEFPGLPAGGR